MSDPIAVDIAALEAGIIARLVAKIPNYGIEAFPDKPESYKLTHQKGAFLVAFRGADYGPVDDTGDVAQTRRMMFDVVIECRQLSGHGGAYTMIELARIALTGYKLAGFTKLSMQRERFLSRGEGVWRYAITCVASTVAVELPDEVADNLLEQLTMDSEFLTSVIPTP